MDIRRIAAIFIESDWGFFQQVKRPWHEANHSPLSAVITPLSHIYIYLRRAQEKTYLMVLSVVKMIQRQQIQLSAQKIIQKMVAESGLCVM
jgi:hypothetical protein